MKRVIIRVRGKVQGVFFRASTKTEAERLKLNGLVRNEPDGSVYIEAEGGANAIIQFANWCKKGPPQAKVLTFDMEESSPAGYIGFRIDRS